MIVEGGRMREIVEMLPQRHGTRMTRIGRIFMDTFNPCASVSSVQYNEPQISRNFGLRSVGVCCAYPSFDKPFLKVYADERRYIHVRDFIKTTHRKGREERKAAQQESLCPLCSPWLNAFPAPAQERAPPQPAPAVHSQSSRAGGMSVEGGRVTEIGAVPEGWEAVRLGDILSLEYGKGLPENERTKGDYPVFGSNGIVGYHEQFFVKGPGIVVGRKGTIGAVTWVDSDFWPIDTTYFVKTKNENVFLKWLFFKLKQSNLPRLSQSDVVPGLKRELVYRITIPLPPLPEQRRIAEVLGTVDSAIQKVGGAIESTERLKKGLMQRLLTRGIGHERFKESEVGRVPEEWEVVRLGEVCKQRNEIVMPSGEGKIKFIGLEHINSGEIKATNYDFDDKVKSSKFRFYRGDILYGKLRPYLDKAIIADFDGICSTDLLVLTTADNKALAEFLIYLIHSNQFIKNSISATSGTNHPRTSWKGISKFKFELPTLPEQRRIVEILSAADRKLELERRRKKKLERVKKGLMNELLTGRKRMKI